MYINIFIYTEGEKKRRVNILGDLILFIRMFFSILLTNLLYYDYKCLCFINILAGHYRIYGALIQGIMEKSGPL